MEIQQKSLISHSTISKFYQKKVFWLSRLSYLIIFLISFIPLMLLLKKNKPHRIIIHLITSLPLTLLNFFLNLKQNLY